MSGESLSPAEETRFVAFVNTYVATIENLLAQQNLALGYSELDSASALQLLAPVLRDLLTTEAGAKWWRDTGPHLYIDDFRMAVDDAVASVLPRSSPEAS